jgi:hypothetical protein
VAHPVKAAADGLVEGIGQVGCAQDQDTRIIGVDALHLHQKLCLDAPRCLALPVTPCAAQRVDLHTQTQHISFSFLIWQARSDYGILMEVMTCAM